MSLSASIQWLIDFVMRRHYRYPHKVPNPNPVKTDFTGHYATISHAQRQPDTPAGQFTDGTRNVRGGLGLDWYITGTRGGVGLWRPNLVGVQHRVRWNELETAKGVYDFSIVSHLLDECTKHNCSGANGKVQMLLMIEDKTFVDPATGPAPHPNPDDYFPDYLTAVLDYPGSIGTPVNLTSTFTGGSGYDSETFRANPYVSNRFKLLIQAMAAYRDSIVPSGFDLHPNFEGIVIQESAIGHADTADTVTPYSAAAYATAIEVMLQAINANFQKSKGFWFVNFMTGGQNHPIPNVMSGTLDYMVANTDHSCMGGPDLLHDRGTLNNQGSGPEGPYQFYETYKDTLYPAGSMQNDSYRELKSTTPNVYYTMEEQFYLAASYPNPLNSDIIEVTGTGGPPHKLHCARVLWDFRAPSTDSTGVAQNDWSDAARVIDANGGFNARAIKKF